MVQMTLTRLIPHKVHKVWGRRDIPAAFGAVAADEEPVGEIWFEHPDRADAELLVKFLFTSERLSIQTHPDDAAAQAAGQPRGKDEAWLIVGADDDARIALGTRRPLAPAELRQAALDGSIVDLVDWRPVRVGEIIYSPAGTIHAIGGGLSVIEIQQTCDITYRLYDYGRPRELHLEEGIAAAKALPFEDPSCPADLGQGRRVECAGGAFVVERWRGLGEAAVRAAPGRPLSVVALAGSASVAGQPLEPGNVYILAGDGRLSLAPGGELLIAYPGGDIAHALLER